MRFNTLLTPLTDSFEKCKTYFDDIFTFLQGHLKSDVLVRATIGIIGVLAFSLLLFTLLAIFNPKKRKLRKLKKTLTEGDKIHISFSW